MKITDHIREANKKTLFSFEILPPKKGENINDLYLSIDPLMEFKPPFIDVTYHREEYVYKHKGNGLLEKQVIRKRPGTVGICAAVMNRYKVDAVPHVICGSFDKEITENALIDFHFLGIDNVLVLRGDAVKTEKEFVPEHNGHQYASELLEQVVNLNKGKYLDEDIIDTAPTNFCIGVAGYPEKHFEAPNFDTDLHYLKKKVEMGAGYIVTQLFFDNQKYIDFVNRCRAVGINVPIIPGIKPVSIKKHLSTLPNIFHIDLPQALVLEINKCKDNKQVRALGIEWSIQQCKALLKFGVPVLHFYSMGKTDNIYKIAKELF